MTVSSEPIINKTLFSEPAFQRDIEDIRTSSISKAPTDSSLLSNKFITHHPKFGLNPLVDAAAYLFSIIGKLKQLKSYRHLNKLQKELVQEIDHFQEAARAQGYSSEYVLVSRFAICATIDDVISNTFWGGQGQWDNYCMLAVFNQEAMNQERFFVILERLIKDPTQYIDVMELMYICLSLGFKGNYRATEFGSSQLEQITNALYKRIRIYHGNFNKTLAPYPIKATHPIKATSTTIPLWIIVTITMTVIMVMFISLGYMLDTISAQANQELMQIGKSLLYDTIHS